MERNLAFLGTVGNNARSSDCSAPSSRHPRVRQLNVSQGTVTAGLMTEIGEALVATAIGSWSRFGRGRVQHLHADGEGAHRARDAMGREVLAFLKSRRSRGASHRRGGGVARGGGTPATATTT